MAHENTLLKTATADYEAVMAQMDIMRVEMAKMAHNVQAVASQRGHAMAKDMSEGMSEAAHYLGRKGHDAELRVEGAVAANPYIALGLAAGMGVLLGALTRR
jgi:ElaB/YqjD/DUF883 family membrane-anchored ribosome-binding protein